MSDPRTGIQQSGPGESAEARRPDEEHQVRAAVQELVDSLERAISPSWVGSVLAVSIFLILIPGTFLVVGLAPGWEGWEPVICVVLGVVSFLVALGSLAQGGVAALLDQDPLIRRAARRFAKRFPEGSPERPIATRMLSGLNTPHRAGQKLLQALPAAEKPTPALAVVVGLSLGLALTLLGTVIGHRLKAWGIGESIPQTVRGAFSGAGLGVVLACFLRPGLKAALISIPACAILFAAWMWLVQKDFGLGLIFVLLAWLGLGYLLIKVLSRYR